MMTAAWLFECVGPADLVTRAEVVGRLGSQRQERRLVLHALHVLVRVRIYHLHTMSSKPLILNPR